MCELSDFLEANGCPPDLSADIIEGVKRSFHLARIGLPRRSDLRKKAERLEKASRSIARELASAPELHFFLAKAEALAAMGDGDRNLQATASQRAFQKVTSVIFQNPEALAEAFRIVAHACSVVTDSKRLKPVLSGSAKGGKPFDEVRKKLGFELAAFWHVATKNPPGAWSDAEIDSPGSYFGRFVVLSADACGARDIISVGFAAFVERARDDYLSSALAQGVMPHEKQ